MADIGFIGLGLMGRPMAARLCEAGLAPRLFSRSGVPEALTRAGGVAMPDAAALAAQAGIVILMLPDTPDVEKVLFGAVGVAEALRPGSVVVDMSTISS